MDNERALTMLEHAIDSLIDDREDFWYKLSPRVLDLAINTLREAHKAIGPLGQIPKFE
jgi:hypothetical protein